MGEGGASSHDDELAPAPESQVQQPIEIPSSSTSSSSDDDDDDDADLSNLLNLSHPAALLETIESSGCRRDSGAGRSSSLKSIFAYTILQVQYKVGSGPSTPVSRAR